MSRLQGLDTDGSALLDQKLRDSCAGDEGEVGALEGGLKKGARGAVALAVSRVDREVAGPGIVASIEVCHRRDLAASCCLEEGIGKWISWQPRNPKWAGGIA